MAIIQAGMLVLILSHGREWTHT